MGVRITGLLLMMIMFSVTPVHSQPMIGCPVGGRTIANCPILTDQVIRDNVATRLAGISALPAMIQIDVVNGAVVLSGQAARDTDIELAEILTRTVPGVKCVTNRLGLLPSVSSDVALVQRVRKALSEAVFPTRGVQLQAADGIVRMTGMVETEYDRSQAGLIAESVPGVTAVQNNLQVRGEGGTF